MQTYRRGDTGPAVAEIRRNLVLLGLLPDDGADTFDASCDRAVRAFQQQRGLTTDGVVGEETYRALEEARWRLGDRVLSYRATRPYVGDDVIALQRRLLDLGFDPGRPDGIFGPQTETALREFQRNLGLTADGTCGPATLKALERLARSVVGGDAAHIRESEALRRAGPAIAGKLVVVDPGHGGRDRGVCANDSVEAEIAEDLAARLEGRLAAAGADVFLTRGPDLTLADGERAAFANAAEADLFVSLHTDGHENPACNGIATYYYESGDGASRSTVGRRLASLIQREIAARTDLLDCRTHGKTWDLLRLTRMPAVRVEIGYLTNPGDARRLATAEFRDAVADGILAAVQRLYLPAEADPPTGTFTLPEKV